MGQTHCEITVATGLSLPYVLSVLRLISNATSSWLKM